MPEQNVPSLDDIIAHKRRAVAKRKQHVPLEAVRALARIQDRRRRPRDVVSRLRDGRLSVIAQVKQATPEKGRILPQYDPVNLARFFERNGAAAIAVSTEQHYYKGGMDHLTVVREAVEVLVLCHDFVVDAYQVYDVRAAGADGLMLMATVLDDDALRHLISLTQRLRMTGLVQVRNEAEAERILKMDPRVVAITCRDPVTGKIDPGLPARLHPIFPSRTTVIASGGLSTLDDVRQVAQAGVDGILVGEALLTATDSAAKIHELGSVSALPANFRRSSP
jgi:indole-3-glycerol phosphate synthase